jgi:hypothetical protein
MILRPLFAAALALVLSVESAAGADPVVAKVTAVQRPGMRLVDITRDLTATALEQNAVQGTPSPPHPRSRTHRQTA